MNDREPLIKVAGTKPEGGRTVHVTTFESIVEVNEQSWMSATRLKTNGAKPVEIFHQVFSPNDTEGLMTIGLQPGESLTLQVEAFDGENKNGTRIDPSIENGRLVFRASC